MATHRIERIRTIGAASFGAVVVILGRSLCIWQAGIDHQLVFAGIDVKANVGDIDILAGRALVEKIDRMIENNPASVDRVDFCFFD